MLPTGTGVQLSIDGRFAMLDPTGTGRIQGAMDMLTGLQYATFNFRASIVGGPASETGFKKDAYRNNIPQVIYDNQTDRFCGYVELVPSIPPNLPTDLSPAYAITTGSGAFQFAPGFNARRFNNPPGGTNAINMIASWGGSFYGIVNSGATVLFPQAITVRDDGLSEGQQFDLNVGHMSFNAATAVGGVTAGGANVYYMMAYNINDDIQRRLGVLSNAFPQNIGFNRTAEDAMGWGQPINTDLSVATTPYNGLHALNDQGAFRNYTFQMYPWGAGSLAICATGGAGGSTIDPTTGLLNHQEAFPPDFDIHIGSAWFLTPQFPPDFVFQGVRYRLAPGNGVCRIMTLLNGNCYAIAQYNQTGVGGPAAHILFAGGVFRLLYLRQDTLNWKRSLTYGIRDPYSLPPGTPDGAIPETGVLRVRQPPIIGTAPGPPPPGPGILHMPQAPSTPGSLTKVII